MRSLLFLMLVIWVAQSTNAQGIDYNKVVLPDHITPNNFEDKLVQLAWKNHPSNKIIMKNVDIAQRESKLTRWKWLDDIYAQGNLNEFTLAPSSERPANVFFPRYNFGIRLSIGTFANTAALSKIADQKVIQASYVIDEKKLKTREEVLTNLEKLRLTYKSFRVRENIKEDYLAMYRASKKKFESGEVTNMDQYRLTLQAYADQVDKSIATESAFNSAKIALEALIGVPLEEVEGYEQLLRQLDAEAKVEE
jgi:outer membrane protein TolC